MSLSFTQKCKMIKLIYTFPITKSSYYACFFVISSNDTFLSSFSDNVHASAVAIDSSAATPFKSFKYSSETVPPFKTS